MLLFVVSALTTVPPCAERGPLRPHRRGGYLRYSDGEEAEEPAESPRRVRFEQGVPRLGGGTVQVESSCEP